MEKFEMLQRSPLFAMLSPPEVELAAELSRQRKVAAGECIYEEGDLGDALFVIASGEVEIIRTNEAGQPKVISSLGPPEYFGELSLIDKEHRSATARARSDCVLLEMTAENLASFRKHHRDGFTFIVMNIARGLSSRLRAAHAKLSARS
jgi:CRP-like cAMP-binding protein